MPDKRLLDDWLTSYLEYTSEQESPESLHRWTGLAVMAASIRRKVYLELDLGALTRLYPNIYIIIVAESAKVRKSQAMDIGRDLLLEALPDMKIMRDSMTSQGLIKSLNHKSQTIKVENGQEKIVEELKSDVAIFADEVANLFSYERTRASQMVIFLTRAYGSPSIYDHTTVRDSLVRLHNLYPVLLGGTDPHNLKVLPEDAIGGLTGRLMWIIESERRQTNSGWKKDNTKTLRRVALREYLIHDLQRIGKIHGEIVAIPKAQDCYNNWYGQLSNRSTKDPATDAFFHRCHTTALKLATLISISQSEELKITVEHMERGIALIEGQLPTVKRITMWSGSSQYEQGRAKFLSFLQNSNGVATRRQLLKHMGMNSDEFEKLKTTLIQDGSIFVPPIKLRNEEVIKLTPEGLEKAISDQAKSEAKARPE